MTSPNPERLRREAKALKSAYRTGDPDAIARVAKVQGTRHDLTHADALHVVAREAGYESWPRLKLAAESSAMDLAARAERLKMALYHGQHWAVKELLDADPELGRANLGLATALYDVDYVRAAIARDPAVINRTVAGPRAPMLHLAFSRHFQGDGDVDDMMEVADLLLKAGADVNASYPFEPGAEHELSALYGAVGHGDNMVLARWFLENGADPNDNESLYHATELGHTEGLELLIAYGADPAGTNALPRALDFNDIEAVRLLLDAGADPNEGLVPHPSGAVTLVIPALHQAARRMASGEIVQLLLDRGADATSVARGHTPYALARVFGNDPVARVLAAAGAATPLSAVEAQLARAADGSVQNADWIDMDMVSEELRFLLCRLVWRDGTLDHMKRLVAMGFDANQPDEMGMPPLHLAAWEGLPDKMAWLLSLAPDLSHVNDYGGTLFSTILHGSENCPARAERDHLGCMRQALELGVAIPRPALNAVGNADMADLLRDWAETHPSQVVAEGVW